MLNHSHKLYDYHVWANNRLFAHLGQLTKDAFHAEVTSVFSTVQETFGHMYLFEQIFMYVLAEVPNEEIFPKMPGWTEVVQGKTVDEMRLLYTDLAEQFRDLLR